MAETIIVTGVNGFVGEHAVDAFKADGFDVIGLAHDPTPADKVAGKLNGYITCDLLDTAMVDTVDLTDVRAILHLAGLSAVGQSFEQPQRYISENAVMTYNLLSHAMSESLEGRVIVVSTGALYDPQQPLPIAEESHVSATSPYAIGKLATEHVVSYFRNRGLDTITVRPFNHIGPGQGGGFLLPDLCTQLSGIVSGGEIMVGNIDTKRDYTDVRDVAAAYKALALAESLEHEVYNVCSGRSLSGRDILSLLEKAMGLSGVQAVVDQSKVRPTDVMDIYGDASRIYSELGWKPQVGIEETIRDFVHNQ